MEVEAEDGENMLMMHTNSTLIQYKPPDGFCSLLVFKVLASNEAGKSSMSVVVYDMLNGKLTLPLYSAIYAYSRVS